MMRPGFCHHLEAVGSSLRSVASVPRQRLVIPFHTNGNLQDLEIPIIITSKTCPRILDLGAYDHIDLNLINRLISF